MNNQILKIAIFLMTTNTFAQVDRAGNVMNDDGGGSSSGVGAVFGGIVVGAVVGAIWGMLKNANSEKKVAVDGCAVMGGMIGLFIGPLISIVIK